MADDVVLNKVSMVERCLRRVREEYQDEPFNLHEDVTKQDTIILNLQRACQGTIDLAMHLVREHDLGVPQESREAFALLEEAGHLDAKLSQRLMRMVGFRNVAIREYQELNLDIVQAIVEEHLSDFTQFTERVLSTDGFRSEESPQGRHRGGVERPVEVGGVVEGGEEGIIDDEEQVVRVGELRQGFRGRRSGEAGWMVSPLEPLCVRMNGLVSVLSTGHVFVRDRALTLLLEVREEPLFCNGAR